MSGNENDNKIISTDIPLPGGNTDFTDRPPHQRNRPE